MLICNIKGGVGNQLFQYACAKAIAHKHDLRLKIDIQDAIRHNKKSDIPRPVSILKLNISADIATNQEVANLRYRYGICSKVTRRILIKAGLHKEELNFNQEILNDSSSRYLDGYFQSYKYFDNIRNILLQEYSLVEFSNNFNFWLDTINNIENTVSIHIRRGDYIKNINVTKQFGPCPTDYFERAVSMLEQKVTKPTYIVFSDDIGWVKENLKLPTYQKVVYVTDKSLLDVEELLLMSKCSHNIISNSSFSWWGAWLNTNNFKQVITPYPWFDNGSIKETDMIPLEWVMIPKYSI
jgi:hypothetical protein